MGLYHSEKGEMLDNINSLGGIAMLNKSVIIFAILLLSVSPFAGANELIVHKILNREELGNIKLSIDVQVELVNGRLPNEKELGDLSRHFVKNAKKHDRSFISFYLPGMKVGAGAYATANHNPLMEVNIMKFILYQYPQYKKFISE